MSRLTQPQQDEAYRQGWEDSLRAYTRLWENIIHHASFDYHQGWHDCARERWRDPKGRGIMPPGVTTPASQAEYKARIHAR